MPLMSDEDKTFSGSLDLMTSPCTHCILYISHRTKSKEPGVKTMGIVLSFSVDLATAADSKKMAAIRHAENELMSFESFSSCCT